MFNSKVPYVTRASRQQEQRRQKKKASLDILNKADTYTVSSDDDSSIDIDNTSSMDTQDEALCTQNDLLYTDYSNSNIVTYKLDDDDVYWNDNFDDLSSDSSLPLYKNSHISAKAAATTIMSMAIELNFPKSAVERILKVFKSLLPTPNLLPTTYASITNIIGTTSTSSSKYYCNICHELCIIRGAKKLCENNKCKLIKQSLRNRQITEVVTLDIKEQLKSIITRNISLLDNKELSQPFDIKSGARYKKSMTLLNELNKTSSNNIYPITLNIHTDGAPLVRTTKACLWPCLASIVELPPQVREKQTNIVVLCLWVSVVKPDVNLFMKDCIKQLLDLSVPSVLTVNHLQFSITVKTQLFIADLPAKALFWKTINYNGYNACANCLTEGTCIDRQVFYPYKKNDYRQRNHNEFLATAKEADIRSLGRKKASNILGVKGTSPLLQIFEYPKQIILDYMHLCCLGQMSTLIQRWLLILNSEALAEIDLKLFSQRFPHNMSVKFNYSISSCSDWKAKHFRIFVLSIGLPIMLPHLPSLVASHFALYSMCIKLLHCPKSNDEIELADKIIHYYCRIAPQIYGETIELFSLHAHLHLPQQVFNHGGLCFTSAFCFESAIRYLKNKAHGTRNLGTQIADWIIAQTNVTRLPFKLSTPTGINNIDINNPILDKYRCDLLNCLRKFIQNENEIILFLRFKDVFNTYHTVLYDLPYNCLSYIVSYKSTNTSIKYGQIIIFFKYHEDYYAFIHEYEFTGKNITDYVSVPDELKGKLNEIFPIRNLSKSYIIIPVVDLCHKCIQVEYHDHIFLSEIRVDYEHD